MIEELQKLFGAYLFVNHDVFRFHVSVDNILMVKVFEHQDHRSNVELRVICIQ